MRSLSIAVLSIICVATLQPAHAQTPDLTTVLEQHQRAVGGPQIVQQLTTAMALWTVESIDGSHQQVESWFASGGRFRQIVRDEDGSSSSALDGQTAYRINSSTGHADVLVGNGGIFRDTGGDDLAVFRGDGTGALAPAQFISAGGSIASVHVTDLDLDGDLDAVAASFGTHEAWLVENRDGTLVPLGSLPCGWAPVAIVAADLDSDGRPDIAVANEFSDDVNVWLNVATE